MAYEYVPLKDKYLKEVVPTLMKEFVTKISTKFQS